MYTDEARHLLELLSQPFAAVRAGRPYFILKVSFGNRHRPKIYAFTCIHFVSMRAKHRFDCWVAIDQSFVCFRLPLGSNLQRKISFNNVEHSSFQLTDLIDRSCRLTPTSSLLLSAWAFNVTQYHRQTGPFKTSSYVSKLKSFNMLRRVSALCCSTPGAQSLKATTFSLPVSSIRRRESTNLSKTNGLQSVPHIPLWTSNNNLGRNLVNALSQASQTHVLVFSSFVTFGFNKQFQQMVGERWRIVNRAGQDSWQGRWAGNDN